MDVGGYNYSNGDYRLSATDVSPSYLGAPFYPVAYPVVYPGLWPSTYPEDWELGDDTDQSNSGDDVNQIDDSEDINLVDGDGNIVDGDGSIVQDIDVMIDHDSANEWLGNKCVSVGE